MWRNSHGPYKTLISTQLNCLYHSDHHMHLHSQILWHGLVESVHYLVSSIFHIVNTTWMTWHKLSEDTQPSHLLQTYTANVLHKPYAERLPGYCSTSAFRFSFFLSITWYLGFIVKNLCHLLNNSNSKIIVISQKLCWNWYNYNYFCVYYNSITIWLLLLIDTQVMQPFMSGVQGI